MHQYVTVTQSPYQPVEVYPAWKRLLRRWPLCNPAWMSGDASVPQSHRLHSLKSVFIPVKHAKSWHLRHLPEEHRGCNCACVLRRHFPAFPVYAVKVYLITGSYLGLHAPRNWSDWSSARATETCGVFTLGTQSCSTCCCWSRN